VGYLDATGIAAVRSAILDCLADEPDLLVVDVGEAVVGTHELGTHELGTHELTTHELAPALAALARQAERWPGCAMVLAGAPAALASRSGLRAYPSVAAVRRARANGRPPDHLRQVLPAATVAAPLARRLVRRVCQAWSVPELSEPAELVVSELVANAIRHTGNDVAVTASLRDGNLRIAVADDDPDLPRPGDARPTDESGRGLLMVQTMCNDWGALPAGAGKVVWARFAVPHLPPATGHQDPRAAGAV
jgi:anti-sigma regulatory factor (Ser/Thr protein kinase)